MTSDSPARSRRLSMMASGVLMRLARPRARTTPPTSGDTTMTLARSKRSLMSRTMTGEADVFLDFDKDFHVGEASDHGLGQRQSKPGSDFLRQGRIGIAGDQLDGAVLGRHRRFSPRFAGDFVQHIGIPTEPARFDERGDIKEGVRLATRRISFSGAKSTPGDYLLTGAIAQRTDAQCTRSG